MNDDDYDDNHENDDDNDDECIYFGLRFSF